VFSLLGNGFQAKAITIQICFAHTVGVPLLLLSHGDRLNACVYKLLKPIRLDLIVLPTIYDNFIMSLIWVVRELSQGLTNSHSG